MSPQDAAIMDSLRNAMADRPIIAPTPGRER
jgi:hypothetical protein